MKTQVHVRPLPVCSICRTRFPGCTSHMYSGRHTSSILKAGKKQEEGGRGVRETVKEIILFHDEHPLLIPCRILCARPLAPRPLPLLAAPLSAVPLATHFRHDLLLVSLNVSAFPSLH